MNYNTNDIIFLVDCDSTLVEAHHMHLDRVNKKFGTDYTIDDIREYDYERSLSKEVAEFIVGELWQDRELYEGLEMISGAREGLDSLRQMGEVWAASYAMVGHASSKLQWLKEQGFDKDDIFLCHRKNAIDADILIDDNPEFLEHWPRQKILFDRPWNRNFNSAPRAYTWDDVVRIAERQVYSLKT